LYNNQGINPNELNDLMSNSRYYKKQKEAKILLIKFSLGESFSELLLD